MARAVASGLLIQSGPKPALALSKVANLRAPLFPGGVVIAARRNISAQTENNSGINGVVSKRDSVARGAGVAEAETSTSGSLEQEMLRAKGDSYFRVDKRPIILFDGVCNMCNGAVNFVLDNDSEGKVRFAALQSEAGRALLARSGRSPDDISSVVLVDQVRAYIKSEAVLQTLRYLGFPFPPLGLAASIVPLFVRDVVYDQVADNRYSIFGQSSSCRLSDNRFEERFISS
ncbi:hypothetical protein R1flu_017389 [Riccia fluitans]|uniref:Thiol-disulfide oxidoreductase DCC n=1 Tax=Riccia fluitans TaxID=41844 RepID=A0ABD1ZCU1_9MARC